MDLSVLSWHVDLRLRVSEEGRRRVIDSISRLSNTTLSFPKAQMMEKRLFAVGKKGIVRKSKRFLLEETIPIVPLSETKFCVCFLFSSSCRQSQFKSVQRLLSPPIYTLNLSTHLLGQSNFGCPSQVLTNVSTSVRFTPGMKVNAYNINSYYAVIPV